MQLRVNELFGPTIQGEGPDIGKACYFLRLHHCPVKCPGCDTAFSWDGSEKGQDTTVNAIASWLDLRQQEHPKCGFVVSGGEPLIHFGNRELAHVFSPYRSRSWISLETSGFVGPKPFTPGQLEDLAHFLVSFSRVVISPKITPCLHGSGWTDEQLEINLPYIFSTMALHAGIDGGKRRTALKFVARDAQDVAAIKAFLHRHRRFVTEVRPCIYVMPYGVERDEVAEGCERLVPFCAEEGWTLSPRVHSLIWGKRRGV